MQDSVTTKLKKFVAINLMIDMMILLFLNMKRSSKIKHSVYSANQINEINNFQMTSFDYGLHECLTATKITQRVLTRDMIRVSLYENAYKKQTKVIQEASDEL